MRFTEYKYNPDICISCYYESDDQDIMKKVSALGSSGSIVSNSGVQSFMMLVEKMDGSHMVCLTISHALWDTYSSLAFIRRFKEILSGDAEDKVYSYSQFIANRRKSSIADKYAGEICDMYLEKIRLLNEAISDSGKKIFMIGRQCPMSREKIDRFNNDSLNNTLNIFSSINPLLAKIDYIPIMLTYHGNSAENNPVMGMKLTALPAVYDVRNSRMLGGLELADPEHGTIPSNINDAFYEKCALSGMKSIVFNFRGIFENEFGNDDVQIEEGTDIREDSKMFIICDVYNQGMVIYMPVLADTYEEAEERSKEITQLINSI